MTHAQDWDPRAPDTLANPTHTLDQLRQHCPIAFSDYLQYSVLRHADVMRILQDPATFSGQASAHVSVPNSMDPPEHTVWRALIDPFLSEARVAAFAPKAKQIVGELLGSLPRNASVELMFTLAHPFALRMQSAYLGWPDNLHAPLLQWIHKKNSATLAGDHATLAAVAHEFDDSIRKLLQQKRQLGDATGDITCELLHARLHGEPITDAALISILRNWTVGELGTLAASVGIIVWYLAEHPELQQQLRKTPALIGAADDEILRLHAPLVANRRTPTCPVTLGGKIIEAGERLTLMWGSANRDEAVFDNSDEFRLDRDPDLNLLYGVGIHACPGAALARLELSIMIEKLLASTTHFTLIAGATPSRAVYPASGFRLLPIFLR